MSSLDVLLGQSASHHLSQSERLNAVTTEEIHALAQDLFAEGKATIVTVSPEL